MAKTYTITIPDTEVADWISAYSFGYQATNPITGEQNPQTQVQYAKQRILESLRTPVIAYIKQREASQSNQSSGATIQ